MLLQEKGKKLIPTCMNEKLKLTNISVWKIDLVFAKS